MANTKETWELRREDIRKQHAQAAQDKEAAEAESRRLSNLLAEKDLQLQRAGELLNAEAEKIRALSAQLAVAEKKLSGAG
jgi:hypothetical protein